MRQPREGICGLFTGTTRHGKTHQVKKCIKKARRVCVWSVKEVLDKYAEVWPDTVIIRDMATLKAELFTRYVRSPAHIVYCPETLKRFGDWSTLMLAWGMCAPCDVVAEELADVSTQSKAPEGWGELVRQGLGFGINIYAVTQRPQESDKTILGNCTFMHTHFLMRDGDRRYMANEMDLTPDQIKAIPKYKFLRRYGDGRLVKG